MPVRCVSHTGTSPNENFKVVLMGTPAEHGLTEQQVQIGYGEGASRVEAEVVEFGEHEASKILRAQRTGRRAAKSIGGGEEQDWVEASSDC